MMMIMVMVMPVRTMVMRTTHLMPLSCRWNSVEVAISGDGVIMMIVMVMPVMMRTTLMTPSSC